MQYMKSDAERMEIWNGCADANFVKVKFIKMKYNIN